ncbi:MAG: mercuric reductase [Gemmatimonadales bacterium]
MSSYDAIIIGSGQAGNPLAHRLADKGWTVALIEREHLGGSCINYGCTPTKALVASAKAAHDARTAHRLGVHTDGVRVDWPAIVERKNRLVQQWRSGQEQHAAKRPTITVIRDEARFVDGHTVRAGGQDLTARHIFINTGTSPAVPPIPALRDIPFLTNRDIMDLPALPRHLGVLGGSYIGLEFGQMFRRFGSDVTIVEAADQLVPHEDVDVVKALTTILTDGGIRIATGTRATAVAREGDEIVVTLNGPDGGPETVRASHLLVTVGRTPNTEALDLDAAGIAHDRGWITVNARLETSVSGVYALGDVTGGPAFTHISYNDFQIVLHNLFHDDKRTTTGRLVPYALFTDPELGRVGLTERAAREAGYRVRVGTIPMSRVARAIEQDTTAGLMKVVIDDATDRLLGVAILGPQGGDVVQTLMALMMADAPWTLFRQAVYIHPTMTEGFFALMESAAQHDASGS